MNNLNEEDATRMSMEAFQKNMNQIDVMRTFLCIIAGVIAGIWGCTGLYGFFAFILFYFTIAFAIGMKIGFDFKQYTNCSMLEFLAGDLQKNGLSFILFWTMTYALIYIY
jgi:ER membrane protein complex subunit 6